MKNCFNERLVSKCNTNQYENMSMSNSVINFVNLVRWRLSYTWGQFHQHFYVQIFRTNVVSAAFSSYVLALLKNLYEKRSRKMFVKLTLGVDFINVLRTAFTLIDPKSVKRCWWLDWVLTLLGSLRAQKLYVKCWWNWHLVTETVICQSGHLPLTTFCHFGFLFLVKLKKSLFSCFPFHLISTLPKKASSTL